jgi:sporulation protein YunB
MVGRQFRGLWLRRWSHTGKKQGRTPFWPSLVLGLAMAFLLIHWFDIALRPQLIAFSESQLQNRLTRIANDAVSQALTDQELSYGGLVNLQTTETLSTFETDTMALNRLRVSILENIIAQVENFDSNSFGVPVGVLTGIDLLSALGPKLPVRVVSVTSADGQYRNEFTSAGINQTLHRIMLDVTLNAKLLLPGGIVEVVVSTPVCIAETVIVGQIPQTYLNLGS